MANPEQRAREEIDRLLTAAGWAEQSLDHVNLATSMGVAIREFPLNPGHGFADYLLYVAGRPCGVIEAKKQGAMRSVAGRSSFEQMQGCTPLWASGIANGRSPRSHY